MGLPGEDRHGFRKAGTARSGVDVHGQTPANATIGARWRWPTIAA
ncbi:hypothetical protein [Cerasicoccus frondis]|nr:hypothetical protein [Cerasicoccus frondis]